MSSALTLPVLVLIGYLTVCFGDEKHWPNLSCHSANMTRHRQSAINFNRMAWNSCLEPYQNWNGACPKVCMLLNMDYLVRKKKGDPLIMDINEFMTRFGEELGIKENSGDTEKKLMAQVRSGMERCEKNHPEHATLNVKNTPCEPWDNFIHCIEDVIGCGRMVVPKKP